MDQWIDGYALGASNFLMLLKKTERKGRTENILGTAKVEQSRIAIPVVDGLNAVKDAP